MIKKYLDVKGDNSKKIEVTTSYSKGGMSLFSYQEIKRGYYVHVQPVKFENIAGCNIVSVCPIEGRKMLLKEVSRASKKAEAEADCMAEEAAKPIIERVCAEQGIELA